MRDKDIKLRIKYLNHDVFVSSIGESGSRLELEMSTETL